jgi:hypothetical protein
MVGISTSRGCATCRRRKIKVCPSSAVSMENAETCTQCDLSRPSCARCIKGKRICDGFEEYPFFINTTLQRQKPRTRPEASKPADQEHISIQIDHDNTSIPSISSYGAWESSLNAWFSTSYATETTARDVAEQKSAWIYHALEISNPTPLLRESLRALIVTCCGRTNGNLDIVRQGQRAYSVALKFLQEALRQEILPLSDELLASVRALALYEVGVSVPTRISGTDFEG